jgi:hypothetical protein
MMVGALLGGYSPNLVEEVVFSEARLITFNTKYCIGGCAGVPQGCSLNAVATTVRSCLRWKGMTCLYPTRKETYSQNARPDALTLAAVATPSTVEEPMSTITAEDGTQIYYKDWGEGPIVTFSHGWPLNADAWDGQMLFLAQNGFRVVAHDRRGHGRSSQASSGNDMNGYADDLAAVIEALDQGRHAGGPLHRRRRGDPLHWPPRHIPSGQGGPRLRSTAADAKDGSQSGGPAARGLRWPARRPHQGPVPVLQGPGDPVLRCEQARR